MNKNLTLALAFTAVAVAGCAAPPSDDALEAKATIAAADPKTDAEYEAAVIRGLHDSILVDIDAMKTALLDLQAAAPTPTDRGWDRQLDAAAIDRMRTAWVRARAAYERIEGVVAPVFPYIDLPLDDRYEGFLAHLGASGGDQYLFDGRGVTGMHAIERIIYLDTTPSMVVKAEATLPGYRAAALPATAQEAADFKNLLCAKAIQDATLLRREWDTAQWNAALAFAGLVDLMTEQREKVNKASSQEEESRYSQRTMADLHENLAGTKRFYETFSPWIVSKPSPAAGALSGRDLDTKIRAGFANIEEGYARIPGAAIPTPPDTWSANPSPQDLATPFGKLFTLVRTEANPNVDSSVVANMNKAAELLHFDQ